ncbi:YfiR family protein [Methylocucumis oryzae]|uniref:YfiR family protein n=1 Tax=Methylocucumis oryzae TaxID=1632867 RepID=UPI000696369D|nr:YfiR family protein [Methylocucumis oryzae]
MNLTKLTLNLFGLGYLLFAPVLCAEDASVEYKIKAGYLYNFTKFITWPEERNPTFNICIIGKDPFGSIIDPIEQRTAMDRPIKLVRAEHYDKSLDCQIVFFGHLKELPIIKKAVLTVSDTQDFASLGGMVSFIKKEGRIKLRINLQAIKSSDLEISAKLLEVSELINGNGHD